MWDSSTRPHLPCIFRHLRCLQWGNTVMKRKGLLFNTPQFIIHTHLYTLVLFFVAQADTCFRKEGFKTLTLTCSSSAMPDKSTRVTGLILFSLFLNFVNTSFSCRWKSTTRDLVSFHGAAVHPLRAMAAFLKWEQRGRCGFLDDILMSTWRALTTTMTQKQTSRQLWKYYELGSLN